MGASGSLAKIHCAAASIQQRVRQDIDIHLNGVGDFVAAAAAATGGVRGVVEPVLRVDNTDPSPDGHAFERARLAVLGFEFGDFIDRVENGMVHSQRLKWKLGKDPGHFAAEGAVPLVRGASRRSEQKAAALDVAAEVLTLAI